VLLKDSAWTVGNRPGNNRGINWELSGFARQTRAEWLDPFGLAMFAQMAPYVEADAAKYGIPLERRTVAELKAFKPGVTSHNDLRLAFGGTTHTDPGGQFPWDVFLATMNGDDMSAAAESQIANIYAAIFYGGSSCGTVVAPANGRPESNSIVNKLDWLIQVATEGGGPLPPPADIAAIKAVLLDPEVLAAQAKAVADEDHARSAD
jgi:hypothetical protein